MGSRGPRTHGPKCLGTPRPTSRTLSSRSTPPTRYGVEQTDRAHWSNNGGPGTGVCALRQPHTPFAGPRGVWQSSLNQGNTAENSARGSCAVCRVPCAVLGLADAAPTRALPQPPRHRRPARGAPVTTPCNMLQHSMPCCACGWMALARPRGMRFVESVSDRVQDHGCVAL